MADENYNLLINQNTAQNTNENVKVDIANLIASNKRVDPDGETKYKAFFYNDIDLVSTDGDKLATLTNNIIVIVLAKGIDGNPICFVIYSYKVTCHGWSAKVPIHVTLADSEGKAIKKIPLREIEVYGGCVDLPDTRIEYFDTEYFNKLHSVNRGGDNSRWIKC